MKTKLKLDMNALQIASFATQPATEAKGTVAAHGTDPVVILTITSSSLLTPGMVTVATNQ